MGRAGGKARRALSSVAVLVRIAKVEGRFLLTAPAGPRRIGTYGTDVTPVSDHLHMAIFVDEHSMRVDGIDLKPIGRRKVTLGFEIEAGQPFIGQHALGGI